MKHAAGSSVVGSRVDLLCQAMRCFDAAGIEGIYHRRGWPAIAVNSHQVVPESAGSDSGWTQACGFDLPMNLRQTADNQLGEFVGIHFHAAVGRGLELIS